MSQRMRNRGLGLQLHLDASAGIPKEPPVLPIADRRPTATYRAGCGTALRETGSQGARIAPAADAPVGAIKIRRILKDAFPIYRCNSRRGAADAQAVGWRPSAPMRQEVTINMGVPYLNLSAISNDSSRIISEIFSGMPYKNAPYSVFFQPRHSSLQ